MNATLDPLAFTLAALERQGALVERDGGAGLVVAEPDLAAALDLPAEAVLASEARDGAVACGFGSPLLERLVAEARATLPVACVRLDVEPPRSTHARSLAERFVVRNGLSDVVEILPARALYVWAAIAWVAAADDRFEGTVAVAACAADGGAPDDAFTALVDPRDTAPDRHPLQTMPEGAAAAARFIEQRGAVAVAAALAPVLDTARRRIARDHRRISAYFADLVAEARSSRRRVDAAARDAKVAHLVAERDAKLRELPARYVPRVTTRVAALVIADAPVVAVRLRLRRRKSEREFILHLPPRAPALDRPPCDACGAPTDRPAVCDDRLHLLCETCAPSAQGRLACAACRA